MPSTEKATFAAGCFWGVEEIFRTTPGVIETAVGYTGGTTKDPTYQDVCTGETGHAEAVQVTYDPAIVSYEKLLEIFWDNHNPTTLNAQGPDVGTQYRSVILFNTPHQELVANNSVSALDKEKKFHRPIVTQILPATTFYPAEEYHQKYLMKRGMGSCHT